MKRKDKLFVREEKLLAERFEINTGYPMSKATITREINLKFLK